MQSREYFRIRGVEYSLVGIRGKGLYTPNSFGIEPIAISSGNWRGYVMTYDCVNGKLILDQMSVYTKEAPSVNGVEPTPFSRGFKYEEIGLKTKFSGKLLLAKDHRWARKWTSNYDPPSYYRTVIEIEVNDGNIVGERDFSAIMEEQYLQIHNLDLEEILNQTHDRYQEDMVLLGYDPRSDSPPVDWVLE